MNFSQKEVENFELMVQDFERSTGQFPDLYPASIKYPELRKAVLNKRLTVYYKYGKNKIDVVAMKDNRQTDPNL